jgi:hypothetical protein
MSSSTGETPSSYLEKISPKDLVFFSPEARKAIAKVTTNKTVDVRNYLNILDKINT